MVAEKGTEYEAPPSEGTGRNGTVEKQYIGAEYQEPPVDKFPEGLTRSRKEDWTVDVELPATDESVRRPKFQPPMPITLKFEDVQYSVSLKPQTTWWDYKSWGKKLGRNVPDKVILQNVMGVVKPGEMLAMLGPSGSGKTTLLNVLGGRIKGNLTGNILYNDLPYNKTLKRKTGFVTQDDVLYAHLTVKETLVYAAILRLPKEFTRKEKIQRADDVIMELGLEKCKNTIIGGPFLRGVSGGERKRVSIGHEMLIDPSLLLLDEPTSGLDSTIALKIIHTLQDLAKGGRTVITTIHQPSSIIYHMFDKLILLSEGHILYYGQGSQAMSYFSSIGFSPSYETNPADFLLDLANGIQHKIDSGNGEEYSPNSKGTGQESRFKDQGDIRKFLRETYAKKLLPRTRTSMAHTPEVTSAQLQASQEKTKWPTSWVQQFSVLVVRSVKERRHEVLSGLRIFQVLATSIIVGLLWWQSSPRNIQDQSGLLFFITTFWGFFPLFSAIFTFPQERQMLAKERASGMYRLTAYFLARTVGDLPLELVLPIISVIIIYWMTGLKATAVAFILTLLTVLFNVLVSQGLGLLLGAVMMDVKKATTLASVLMLTFQLAGGYFVTNIPAFIAWIKWLSFSYHGFRLAIVAQYTETQTYDCETGQCRVFDFPLIKSVGTNEIGFSIMAMFLMLFGFRFLAYLALRNMKR